MSLRWDSLLVRHVARELDHALSGARLRAIRLDGTARDVFLLFRDRTLVWRLHPTRGYPLLRPPVEPAPSDLAFPSRLRRVHAPADERLVRFELLPARAGRPARDVIVELFGNQWNALVIEGPQATLRHVLWTRKGKHARQVGAAYTPPAGDRRLGAGGGDNVSGAAGVPSLTAFAHVLDDVTPRERARALVGAVAWTSSINAGWILGGETARRELSGEAGRNGLEGEADRGGLEGEADRGGLEGETEGGELSGEADRSGLEGRAHSGAGAAEGGGLGVQASAGGLGREADAGIGKAGSDRLAAAYARWLELAGPQATATPVLLETSKGPQPYPFPLPPAPYVPVRDLCAAFELLAGEEPADPSTAAASLLPQEWAHALEREIERASRRVGRLEAEARELPDAGALRQLGDLLLARYSEIPTGAAEARIQDFAGNEIVVPLDPSVPVHESATRYYRQASRAERACQRLPGLTAAAVQELRRLTDLQERAGRGEADAAEVAAALPAAASRAAASDGGVALPYRIFRSSGGLEIRVGRGARHNDELTFHHASPDDVWLHARHSAGAHVVLRWPGPGSPPARDLEEAATLAALHSKSRTSGSVPVDWTLRKYVRKPRGAAPGSVRVERERTIFVRPDAALEDALAEP